MGDWMGKNWSMHLTELITSSSQAAPTRFGMVSVEALSRGLPVIAYSQEMGPNCVIGGTAVDTLAPTLGESYERAKKLSPDDCIKAAERFSPTALFEAFLKIEAALESNEPAMSEPEERIA